MNRMRLSLAVIVLAFDLVPVFANAGTEGCIRCGFKFFCGERLVSLQQSKSEIERGVFEQIVETCAGLNSQYPFDEEKLHVENHKLTPVVSFYERKSLEHELRYFIKNNHGGAYDSSWALKEYFRSVRRDAGYQEVAKTFQELLAEKKDDLDKYLVEPSSESHDDQAVAAALLKKFALKTSKTISLFGACARMNCRIALRL